MTDQHPTLEFGHQPDKKRFTVAIGADRGGFLDYRPVDHGVWDLTYTFVPRQDRGSGIGRDLVLHVLAHAREHGLKVIPTCGFVADVIDDHPEFRDLVASRGQHDD